MDDKRIAFIYCVNNWSNYYNSFESIKQLKIPKTYSIEVVTIENADSITQGYNNGMNKTNAKYKVFLHQDVTILNKYLLENIIEIFNKHPELGMLGTIGSKDIPKSGIWSDSTHRYGKVYESSPGYMRLLKNNNDIYGDYESVKAIDGLVMITQYDIPWREDLFKGWHFYDISQCCEFIRYGYNVGVPKQQSPWFKHDCGIVDKTGFEHARKIFIENYGI